MPYLWVKLATSFFLSSCCSRHLALNLKLLTRRRRRRGVAEGWKIRFAAHAGQPPQTLHLNGQQRAILAGSQHFTSKDCWKIVERRIRNVEERVWKSLSQAWPSLNPPPRPGGPTLSLLWLCPAKEEETCSEQTFALYTVPIQIKHSMVIATSAV